MLRILSFAALLALGGCSLLLGTDGLAGDGATTNANDGGSSGGGGGEDSATTGDSAPSATDAGADAAIATRKLGPLAYFESNGLRRTRVDGFFDLAFADAMHSHATEWFDLGRTDLTNLAGSPALYQAPRANLGGVWAEDAVVNGGDAGSYGVVDLFVDTPVLVSFNTFVHHLYGGGIDVKRWAKFTVHATGRVVVESKLVNSAPPSFAVDEWTYHDVELTTQVQWERLELANKSAYGFFSPDGTSSLTMINQAGDTLTSGSAHEVRWTQPGSVFLENQGFTKIGEIHLGATKDDVVERVDDARNPVLEVISGGDGAASTYVLASGVYAISATSGTLQFALGPTRKRFHPTFDIKSFNSPTWKLSLDGVVIASAQQPVTEHAVAKYDATDSRLLFAYFGVIPANAPAQKRTFVLER